MKLKNIVKLENLPDYIKYYKSIKDEEISNSKEIKIAVLSSSTIRGLKETLFVKCYQLNISAKIFIGEYNQYTQEILDTKSALYKFDPDLVILFIDTRALLGDTFFDYYFLPAKQKKDLLKNNIEQLELLISKMKSNLKCKIVLHNFEVPISSQLGIVENKQDIGFIDFVKRLNNELEIRFKNDNEVFVFDFESFCSKYGKDNVLDYKMYYLGDIKVSFSHIPSLCDSYISYIIPLASLTKKCIVLDLDNTLWGGVIGEDGLEGIKLGPTPEGRPFLEFQKYILSLYNRGIILAINSKNNLEDVLEVFNKHPYMVLKQDYFASTKINWNDKISNMKDIAKEINIGLDSIVFFDDDKLNREMVRSALNEVAVVDLPEDPSLYLKTIMELNYFNSFQISEEDKKKGQMYAEQKKRQELKKSTTDITEYLEALNMVMTIEKANSFTIPRISQLTQKTNQFNLTTKRYLEEDIKKFSTNKDCLCLSIKVEDKFGDNGIVGVVIIDKKGSTWKIDTFLLSCRVIGRNIEKYMLGLILKIAMKEDVKEVIGEYIPSNKNMQVKHFYSANEFNLLDTKDNLYSFKINQKELKDISRLMPDYIKLKTEVPLNDI
jgi:FkbH-like protein